MKNLNILKNKINQLKTSYCKLAESKSSLLTLIAQTEIPELVYNSNAIENSTLSLNETEKILLQLDLDRFISERELFEAKNLARVVEYLDANTNTKKIDIELILFLHKMLLSNINDSIAGRFRQNDEWVRVGNYIASDPKNVVSEMNILLHDYNAESYIHIIPRLAKFHLVFEHIHPFVDGNGRIGRVLLNYLLLSEGYPPINIRFSDRNKYYEAFKEFELYKKTTIMEELISRALINSFYKRIAYMQGYKIITLSEYAKIHKLSHSNLLNKANRQTIPAFTERGIWKIANSKQP